MSTAAFAREVTITTTVPERHTVSVEADGGKIVADHQICGDSIRVERQTSKTYWIIPDGGKRLSALYYNGQDVTGQVRAGLFKAPALTGDAILQAVFEDIPAPPEDDRHDVSGTVTDEEGSPIPGATVDIGGQTGITDEDGNFTVEDVPAGTWPVTVTDQDGNIIGIGEVTIEEPEGGAVTAAEDENGNPIITPGSGTTTIGMNLVVGGNGVIAITDVKDATPEPSQPGQPQQPEPDQTEPDQPGSGSQGGGPSGQPGQDSDGNDGANGNKGSNGNAAKTGDESAIGLWPLAALISAACIVVLPVTGRARRRSIEKNQMRGRE